MSIDLLMSVVAPPSSPIETGTEHKWEHMQKLVAAALPRDFYDFGMVYGSGGFRDPNIDIWIYQPFWHRFKESVNYYNALLSRFKADQGDQYIPYDVFPASSGLLVWGNDVEGNELYWLTEGKPDDWPIIIRGRDDSWEEHNGPMTSFLAKAFTRQIDVHVWPDPYFVDPSKIIFVPETEYS